MDFSWDPKKAAANVRKHGVTFTEAATAFEDPQATTRYDSDHHERAILIGYSQEEHLLVVVHIEIVEESWVRIISARKASPRERKVHERGAR